MSWNHLVEEAFLSPETILWDMATQNACMQNRKNFWRQLKSFSKITQDMSLLAAIFFIDCVMHLFTIVMCLFQLFFYITFQINLCILAERSTILF